MSVRVRRGMHTALKPPLLPALLFLFLLLAAGSSAAVPPMRAAYVVGSSDGSVTRVDLETGATLAMPIGVGTAANRIEAGPLLRWALCANSGSDDLTVIDLEAETVRPGIDLPPGANPWAVEASADGRWFVTALLRDLVYEVDPEAGAVIDSFAVGVAPEGMTITDGKLYVANSGFDFDTFEYGPGSVSVVNLSTGSTVATVPTAVNPQECLLAPDGTVHVVCTGDYGAASGAVQRIDPTTDTVLDTLPVDGFPGGAVALGGSIFLNVTTPVFSSEIHRYDAVTLAWIRDAADPLLPSFDFYGNLRATSDGLLAVPDFSADLLLLENPDASGSPAGLFTGDGPIDLAVVERSEPVPVILSGIAVEADDRGVHLRWNATPEADVISFAVERSARPGRWERRADALPVRRANRWTDAGAPTDLDLLYRIGARDSAGNVEWSPPVAVVRPSAPSRLAVQRVLPNPSRGAVTFRLAAPSAGDALLEVHDVTGRRVASRRAAVTPGVQDLEWDGRDEAGRPLAPGAYFARWTVGAETGTARLLRVR